MGIIKWLNSHVVTSIILYFALMVGVAWSANQAISDRTALAVMPADDDVLAIYDLSTTSGKSIAVSVFRGDNLNAIVNAETGVTDPQITMYDDNGASTGTAAIYGQSVDGTKAIVMTIGVEEETTGNAAYIELDGITETVDVLKPLTAPVVDGGVKLSVISSDFNMETGGDADVCEKVYVLGSGASGDVTITLPSSGNCNDTAGYAKRFKFISRSTDSDDLVLAPNTSDAIFKETKSCVADSMDLDTGTVVVCEGYESANTIWFCNLVVGTSTCN